MGIGYNTSVWRTDGRTDRRPELPWLIQRSVLLSKNHKVISSLNKCLTENVLNWSPSCFVTAAVLPDILSTAKSETTFRRLSWVALAWSALRGTLSCTNTKSPDLNHWESNMTKMGRDWWSNNILEGYVYSAVEKRLAVVPQQEGDQFSTASVKLVLMLLKID